MARKKKATEELGLATLLFSKDEAETKLQDRVDKGVELETREIRSETEFNSLKEEVERWGKYNEELLTRLFTNKSVADEYLSFGGGSFLMDQSWHYWVEVERKEIRDYTNRLKAILERLELFPTQALTASSLMKKENGGNKVFLVHGRDNEAKQITARFLEQLGLEPVILHEQASGGRTIIEKFEHYSDVAFAVVLLTPDDKGCLDEIDEILKTRARQNVILELGFFIGKLGRKHVCPIYWPGVETPSDYNGVVYVPFDNAGGWKLALAKEIKYAGLDVDMNRALS